MIPISLQQLMLALVNASDAFMLGFLSQDALSAVSLAGQIQFVYSLFLFAITAGVSIFAAQYWGIQDRDSVEKTLGIGLAASVLISLPFTIGASFFPEQLMRIFASDPVLIEDGAVYLRVVGISYFLLSISQIYLCILKNCGHAVESAVISSVSVVINIFLNAAFIFGIGFFPEMGIAGAALATVLSKVIELFWGLSVMLKKDYIKIRLRYAFVQDKTLRSDFWKYTLPILGDELVWGVGFTMYSVIMGHMGSDAAAANSIANIIKNLVICFCTGIATAGGIMVGGLLGQGELEKAKLYGKKITKASILAGAIAGGLILCIIPFVSHFSTLTETAQHYLRVMLVVCSYYVIGKSINMTVISGIFPSGGDSKFGFFCDSVTMWCVTVPIGLLTAFVLKLPVLAVYILINVDEIIKLPAVYRNYKKYRWVKNLTRQKAVS
ncbi:MATE family efflux transporter [uncultured Ruminococcus sp.]|nr:MATE family efflux transporter [uncultured Ruminococcus sp.]